MVISRDAETRSKEISKLQSMQPAKKTFEGKTTKWFTVIHSAPNFHWASNCTLIITVTSEILKKWAVFIPPALCLMSALLIKMKGGCYVCTYQRGKVPGAWYIHTYICSHVRTCGWARSEVQRTFFDFMMQTLFYNINIMHCRFPLLILPSSSVPFYFNWRGRPQLTLVWRMMQNAAFPQKQNGYPRNP